MNSAGPIRPRTGCSQRASASRGADAPGVEVHDRLVLDHDLAALDRRGQLLLEIVAAEHRGCHRRIEEREAALARRLRLVHRQVGLADQLVGVARAAAVGDADAQMNADQLVAGVHGRRERSQHPLGDRAGFRDRVVDARQHHRELVAAQPRDDVLRAHGMPEPAGHGDEQRVADGVAERVVDDLEVVEVDEQDAERLRAGRELGAQALHEQQPVGQLGERVVVGLMVELLLQRVQLRDGLLEPVVLQCHAGVVGEHFEQAAILDAVAAFEPEPVREHDDADQAALARQHGDHGVPDPAPLQESGERRRERDHRGVRVDQRGELLGRPLVGLDHRHALLTGPVGAPQCRAVGAEEDHLRDLRAERLQRAGQDAFDRLCHLR